MISKHAWVVALAFGALLACSSDDGGSDTTPGAGTTGDPAGGAGATAAGDGTTGGAGTEAVAGEGGGSGTGAGTGGSGTGAGTGGSGTGAGTGGTGSGEALSFEEAQALIDSYAAAHPGQDGDINAKTPDQIAADPDAQALMSLCGEGAVPMIPALAWEYGGNDHAFMNPEQAPLVICVSTPAVPNTEHWQYDEAADQVTVDVWVLYPDQNPCKDESGADQVAACIGDTTNFEIIVDLASGTDGHEVGLELSEASTQLMLILPDGSKVELWFDA